MNADIVHEWLAIVGEDLVVAGNCVHGRPPTPKQAAFFIQQAAEKLVKAVLVAWAVRPRHSHDIAELVDLIPKTHPGRPSLVGLHRFTRYAVVFRDPLEAATEPVPVPADIDRWIAEIEALKADFAPREARS